MSEEWGPWIEHDGKGCPCVGMYVRVELNAEPAILKTHALRVAPRILECVPPRNGTHGSWFWLPSFVRVIRYRIRKPRGLTILENLLADLPAPQPGKVDA